MWFYGAFSHFVDGFSQEKNVISAGWVLYCACNINFMTVKFSSWCLDLQLCHLVQCVDFHRVCLVVIPILEIRVRSGKFTETQVIREPNQYNISELSLIFNHVTPSIVNIYFPLTKYIISCPSISLQKNTHIPSQGHFLEFEPPRPPLWESWESCFPFKTLTFETLLPLWVPSDLPWGGYGSFQELHYEDLHSRLVSITIYYVL